MTMEIQVDLVRQAVVALQNQIGLLGAQVDQAAYRVAEPTDALGKIIADGLRSQKLQQRLLIWLTAVIASATVAVVWVTLESVVAVREQTRIQGEVLLVQKEQNQIQREALDFQKASVASVDKAKK